MVIGIKEQDRVVLAFSSFDGSALVSIDDLSAAENVGLWKVKGNPHTVMACGVLSPESDAFRYEEDIFKGEINYKRLIEEIVPNMEKFAEDKDYIGDEKGWFDEFFIAQNDRLFKILGEHIVNEIDDAAVLGESRCEDISKGILHVTRGEPTLERIRKVFELTAGIFQYDCYPISVMDTLAGKIRVLTRNDD